MRYSKLYLIQISTLLVILLTGCGAPASPTPTPLLLFATPTPAAQSPATTTPAPPTIAPQPSPTPALSPTAAPTATRTPTPTLTPTATGTPTPTPTPHAIINSPDGLLNVRSGPGLAYDPPLGAYNNGAVVDVLGKQYDANGELWWMIPFAGSPTGQGWIFAKHTIARGVENIPWINPPSLPTPTATFTPTPPPAPYAVINSPDGFLYVRSGPGTIYQPPIGAYQNGFTTPIIGKQYAPGSDDLWWLIPFPATPNGQGWIAARYTIAKNVDRVPWIVAPPTPTPTATRPPTATPTATPTITVTPSPLVEWTITGRVVDVRTLMPVVDAQIEAILGLTAVRLTAVTDSDGAFALAGQAEDAGPLTVNITATGYQPFTIILPPATPRRYELPDLQLAPLSAGCRYESVVDVSQSSGIARLNSLGFTTVLTTPIYVSSDASLVGMILTQSPQPPPPDQLVMLDCSAPITLGIGFKEPDVQ